MTEYIRQLAEDFRCEVLRFIKEGYSVDSAIRKAAQSPAPRFYVGLAHARRYASQIARGIPIATSNPVRTEMYTEILRRYFDSGATLPINSNRLAAILEQPAPSWYRDIETLRQIYYKVK